MAQHRQKFSRRFFQKAAAFFHVERAQSDWFLVQRNVILGLLLALAATGWALLARQGANGHMDMTMATPTMGMSPLLFVTTWVVMMVAMMFPSAAPMILTFHKVQVGRRQRGDAFVATWLFVTAYMVVWTLCGVIAYGGAVVAEVIAMRAALSPVATTRIGGVLLVAAGLYQLTPFKERCLSKCRTPISFIMTSWRDGRRGALRMGLLHGAYCLGCCWLLFVILFPLGIMNISAMAVITLVIFAEKTSAWGRTVARTTAVVLVAYGAVALATPHILPVFMEGGYMPMPGNLAAPPARKEPLFEKSGAKTFGDAGPWPLSAPMPMAQHQ